MNEISVYITSFNQKKFLSESIESVLYQTLIPDEILIIDDCSTDGSQTLIKEYRDRNSDLIKCIFHKSNKGIVYTRNEANDNLSGRYISFLDGDDIYEKEKIEKEFMLLKSDRNINFVISNFHNINEDGEILRIWADSENHLNQFISDPVTCLLSLNFPLKTPFRFELFDRDIIKNISYDRSLKIWEDLDFRIQYSENINPAYIHEPLSRYRRISNSLSNNQDLHFTSVRYIFKKHKELLHNKSLVKKLKVKISQYKILSGFLLNETKNNLSEFKFSKALRNFIKSMFYWPLPNRSFLIFMVKFILGRKP